MNISVPCPEIPKIPSIPSINILGLVEMKGILDFSLGTPRDCTLNINLLLQIIPLLASMTCLLKMLAVIQALEETVKSGFMKTGDLLDKIAKLSTCFGALTPPTIAITLKGLLSLIINFVSCFLDNIESLIKFRVSIAAAPADAQNLALQASLECALTNSQNSLDNLILSLESVQPLLDMVVSLGAIGGFSFTLPSMTSLAAEKDPTKVISSLKQGIDTMKQAIASLPG
jgi:hypothetical protein